MKKPPDELLAANDEKPMRLKDERTLKVCLSLLNSFFINFSSPTDAGRLAGTEVELHSSY